MLRLRNKKLSSVKMNDGKKLTSHHSHIKVHQKLEEVSQVAKVLKKVVAMKETRISSSKMKDQSTAQYSRKEVRKTLKMKMIEKSLKKMIN